MVIIENFSTGQLEREKKCASERIYSRRRGATLNCTHRAIAPAHISGWAGTLGAKGERHAAQFHGQPTFFTTKRAKAFCARFLENLCPRRVNLTQNACNPRNAAG
jgi:hypothetical protein